MKVIMEFNLPEESEEFENASNGWKYSNALEEIWQELFRPRNKHGYTRYTRLNKLLNCHGGDEKDTPEVRACNELMDQLEQMYLEIKNEHT